MVNIILTLPALSTICVKLLSEQSYFVLFFYLYYFNYLAFLLFFLFILKAKVYNANAKIAKYSLLFVSGKKAILSYELCACFD